MRTVAALLTRAKDSVHIDARNDTLKTASDLARNGFIPQMLEMARRYQSGEISVSTGLPEKLL